MKTTKDYYENRFKKPEFKTRNKIWEILCTEFFQKYINKNDTVMDIGAGYCEFINNIKCKTKIAVDINPDITKFAARDVNIIKSDPRKVPDKFKNKIDKIFISNFLEHLEKKEDVIEILEKSHELLKPGGKILILQPNISLTGNKYWDFIDHKTPLTEKSVIEALEITKFKLDSYVRRFLPYTTKGNLIQLPILVSLYLKIPSQIRPLAGQSFFIATKSS